MKLVADEGVDRPIVDRLREEGHDVLYIAELEPGMDDEEVLARATSTEAVLLTTDTDFGEFAFRQRRLHTGVILLRLAGLTNNTKAEIVAEVCRTRAAELGGAFSVISPGQLRIRARF